MWSPASSNWPNSRAPSAGLHTVALSGGVFQNALLLSGASRALQAAGFTVLRHRIVPPNDGGIALGQLVVSAARAADQAGAPPVGARAATEGAPSCA